MTSCEMYCLRAALHLLGVTGLITHMNRLSLFQCDLSHSSNQIGLCVIKSCSQRCSHTVVTMSVSTILLPLLLLLSGSSASHFHGGTMTFNPKGVNADGSYTVRPQSGNRVLSYYRGVWISAFCKVAQTRTCVFEWKTLVTGCGNWSVFISFTVWDIRLR